MRPVILLTCSGLRIDKSQRPDPAGECTGQCAPGATHRHPGCLKAAYIEAVERAGGAPMLLPNADGEVARAAVRVAEGLLLTGGCDVDPASYGQVAHPSVTITDPLRDATEIAAIRAAAELGIPILGVCRGIQILNVALGGTLIQDLPDTKTDLAPAPILHKGADHDIRTDSGTIIRGVWSERRSVNSRHHQAVDRLSEQLRATAWADDGIIEAVQSKDGQILGVQSHPEDLIDRPAFLAPFQWLVQMALGQV